MKPQTHIVLLVGGPSVEHDISLLTGKTIFQALDKEKYQVTPVVITKEGKWRFQDRQMESGAALDKIKADGADLVFIAMHGAFGEDGMMQGMLELAGLPYTGSGVLASALAMHKPKANELFLFHGLRVPEYLHFSREQWQSDEWRDMDKIRALGFPLVIKPVNLGSSIGISLVKNQEDLAEAIDVVFRHGSDVMAQKYVKGVEVSCAVLDEGKGQLVALPPTEIIPKSSSSEFFDYEAKYTAGASEKITPARLSPETLAQIQAVALIAHRVLGCSGMSRSDMIVAPNTKDIFVLETNTIPEMTETSLLRQAAAKAGISFPQVLEKIIDAAGLRSK